MDIKEYIASGVVELYALGVLPAEEKTEFEQRLLMYPDLKGELLKVQAALENFASSHARNPRPSLRAEILVQTKALSIPAQDKSKDHRIQTSHSLTYKYLIAASLAALVISTFASWFFYSRWNESEDRYIAILKEKNQMMQNYNVMKNSFDKYYSDLMILRDENAKVYMLMPVDSTKKYQARVYWNKYTREVYIDVLSMPDPEDGTHYQLWAMYKGLPVDAGIFSMDSDESMQQMKNIISADAWAVTVEPKVGSTSPDMSRVFLLSKNI